MNDLIIIFGLLFITYIGFITIQNFHLLKTDSDYEIIPYGFGLGTGIISFELIFYSLVHIPWNLLYLCIPFAAFFFYCLIHKKAKLYPRIQYQFTGHKVTTLLLFLTIALLLYVGFEAQLRPLYAWDGWAIWLMKAKVFFIDKQINPSRTFYFENDYPHVFSLIITYLFLFLGKIDDRAVLLIFFAYYFFLGLLFFIAIKEKVGVTLAFFFTFLLLSTQNLIRHGGRWDAGYADLPLGYYFFASVLVLGKYLKSKNYKELILLQIFLAITSQIKNEGLPFTVWIELIIVYVSIKNRNIKTLAYGLIWLIPVVLWEIYKKTHVFYPNYLFDKTSLHIVRIFPVIIGITREICNISRWNFLWIFSFFGFLYFIMQKKKDFTALIYLIFILQLSVYIFIYLLTPHNVTIHISNTIDRLLLHLTPLAFYASIVTVFPNVKKE